VVAIGQEAEWAPEPVWKRWSNSQPGLEPPINQLVAHVSRVILRCFQRSGLFGTKRSET